MFFTFSYPEHQGEGNVDVKEADAQSLEGPSSDAPVIIIIMI